MKQGWEEKKLMEIAEVCTGKHDANHAKVRGKYRFYTCAFNYAKCDTNRFSGESLILPGNGVNVGEVFYYDGEFDAYQRTYVVNNIKIFPKFLHYHMILFWKELGTKLQYGSATNFIKIGNFQNYNVSYPPLPQQQRIVSTLDEVFEGLNKAKTNAEQNLRNAKELFESYLQGVFEKKGEGWEEKSLGELATFRNGMNFTKGSKGEVIKIVGVKDFQQSFYVPVETLESATIDGKLNEIDILKNGDILAVRSNGNPSLIGRTLLANGVEGNVSHSGFTIRIRLNTETLLPIYLCSYLKTQKTRKELVDSGNGVGIKSLNQGSLSSLLIPYPKSLKDQQSIVQKLDALSAETKRLEAIYQQKILDLDELKKSILQKAFNGELTSLGSAETAILTMPLPLQKVERISTTDLQAGITAIALIEHVQKDRLHTLHHVKAEKIVHLSEYILNVDLERNPVKDAAGPNDFPHAKKVESRAQKAGFYKVVKNGDYYDYQQGHSINNIIQKTKNCLGEKTNILINLLNLLIPMSTQQAEIVATVYAAWNNLILVGNNFSTEDIVTEARENWHKKKEDIPREKFFNAINWMKKYEFLIPIGNGKLVKTKSL